MSEPWTDDKIREGFIYDGGESEYHDPEHGAQTQRKIAGDIFDAWLAEHDRQVAERAWGEGAWMGHHLYDKTIQEVKAHSPYRAAKEEPK